jgi:hypothetical protein
LTLWDAVFDRDLVIFDDGSNPQFSNALSEVGRSELRWHEAIPSA